MAKVTAVITGDKKLNRKLSRLTSKQQKKAFRDAARPAIKPVMTESRSNAKANSDTGRLAKSIKVRSLPRSRSRIGVRVTTRADDFGRQFYASFQEYGWKAGKLKRPIKGTENMQDAARVKKASVIRDYKRRLAHSIAKVRAA